MLDLNVIDAMWKKGTSAVLSSEACPPVVSLTVTCDKKTVPKTAHEKYCKALSLSKQICTILSDCGTNQFGQRYQVLKDLLKIWAKGEEAIALQHLDNNRALTSEGKGKKNFVYAFMCLDMFPFFRRIIVSIESLSEIILGEAVHAVIIETISENTGIQVHFSIVRYISLN
jgi:hypothetical protein